jgi:hypothetical protein
MFRDMGAGSGEGMKRPEAVGKLETVELKSRSQIEAVLDELQQGNLLNERPLLERIFSNSGDWLATVESAILGQGGAAFAFKEEGRVVGFVLLDPKGLMTQFRALAGRDKDVLDKAIVAFKDKGFSHLDAQLTEESEHMKHLLHQKGFHGEEHGEDGKVKMSRE